MDELIKKIMLGDKNSASEFVNLFYDDIFLYVLKLTLNRNISLDLTQEIFVRAINKINTLKKEQNVKSWLYRIAHNYVMTYFKLTKNNRIVSNEILEMIPATTNLEAELIRIEDNKKILKLVYQLDELYRDIIILRYYEELSIKEIALILKMNENTVKTRISRGLEKLKSYFESGEMYEFK